MKKILIVILAIALVLGGFFVYKKKNKIIDTIKKIENKSPMELFEEFFELQSNRKMEKEEQNIAKKAINIANGEAKGEES